MYALCSCADTEHAHTQRTQHREQCTRFSQKREQVQFMKKNIDPAEDQNQVCCAYEKACTEYNIFQIPNQLATPILKVIIEDQLYSAKSSGAGTVFFLLVGDQERKYDRVTKKNL